MNTQSDKYCPSCGQGMDSNAGACPSCGATQPNTGSMPPPPRSAANTYSNTSMNNNAEQYSDKDWTATLLLCILTGYLGIHRFYTGHILIGVLQIITLGGCGIWTLVDLILIVTGSFKDSEGRVVKQK